MLPSNMNIAPKSNKEPNENTLFLKMPFCIGGRYRIRPPASICHALVCKLKYDEEAWALLSETLAKKLTIKNVKRKKNTALAPNTFLIKTISKGYAK
tara:strand:+ start:744 stop:1034 length:291 start_codon:yes stop_codon:yes gene_type:complete